LGPLPLLLAAALWAAPASGPGREAAAQAATPPVATRGIVPGPGRLDEGLARLGPEALGRGAVGRTFTAPADGWYRLAAKGAGSRWTVTVANPDSGAVVASSRWAERPDESGALLHAKAGSSYAVSVGILDGPGGEFALEWTEAPPPVRLRYAGRLVNGGPDARGTPVEIRQPGDLAFGAGRLFLASGLGLSVFERDPATGGLAFARLVDADLAGASLAWDAGRSRLIAHRCGTWLAFNVGPDGAVGAPQAVAADGDPAHCGRLLLDAEGGFAHRAGAAGVDAFSVRPDGSLRHEATAPVAGLRGAVLGEGGRVYAAGADGLLVLGRDGRAERFTAVPAGVNLVALPLNQAPLAVDADRKRLLAVDAAGAHLFALGGGPAPVRLATLPAAPGQVSGAGFAGCAFAALRPGAVADLFCAGGIVTAQWREEAKAFAPAGRAAWPGDRAALDFQAPVATAATPDGRHVYVSTRFDGILLFERAPGWMSHIAGDDHGDDRASATPLGIPSVTRARLESSGDRDYFRIDIIRAGTLRLKTTGNTDTYGTLYYAAGVEFARDDDSGSKNNFDIRAGSIGVGTYFLEVRGFSPSSDRGPYRLVVRGTARALDPGARSPDPEPPEAAAPSVSINAIAAGDEGTTVRLGAALTGGAYDGAPEYAWSVDGGTLDDAASATPTWARPSVASDANHRVRLRVTVRGTGTNARNGSSASADASRSASVRDVPQPPEATAPSVSINAIAAGDEGTDVRLGAALSGGAYDGSPEYAWSVDGGTLDDAGSATPAWTRPTVTSDASFTVRLRVTVRGGGTNARNGSSASADASQSAQVRNAPLPAVVAPSVSINIGAGNEGAAARLGATLSGGTYEGAPEYAWSVDAGLLDDPASATPIWVRPQVASDTHHRVRLTVTVRGTGVSVRSGSAEAQASRSALVRNVPPPPAAAPRVSIGTIPPGEEGTQVQLEALVSRGGLYDGAPEYAWSVEGGTLDDAASATPTWTRPSVTSNANYTVRLRVTVRGGGTNARSGSSDTASASWLALVRKTGRVDHGGNRASATPVGIPSTTAGEVAPRDKDYFRIVINQAGTLTLTIKTGMQAWGSLYNGVGTLMASRQGDGRSNLSLEFPAIDPGTYYFEVRGLHPSTTGTYELLVSGSARGPAPGPLPAAAAPSVSIPDIAAGDEGTDVRLRAVLAGGTYDGNPEYAWSVDSGTLDDARSAAPTWTRPSVAADTSYNVRLRVTVRGANANARSGSSASADASRSALVREAGGGVRVGSDHGDDPPSATAVDIPSTTAGVLEVRDKDYFRIDIVQAGTLTLETTGDTDTFGMLLNRTGSEVARSDDDGEGFNFRIAMDSIGTGTHYLEVRGYDALRTTGAYSLSVSGTARAALPLPAALAPSVTIDAIPADDEGTEARLGATLSGGTYDGNPEYAWSVDAGTLDDPGSAAPTWTRPSAASDRSYQVRLRITVRGADGNARSGSAAVADASESALVRDTDGAGPGDDHGDDRASATPVGLPSTTEGVLERGDEDYFRIDLSQEGMLRLETTGGTDTWGTLYDSGGTELADDDDGGSGTNFRITTGSLGVGAYYLKVEGFNDSVTGNYRLRVQSQQAPSNSPPMVNASRLPSTVKATAGGAALIFDPEAEDTFPDPDGEFVWLEPSSDNESVATVALEGPSLVVHPGIAGSATVTVTARDPSGASATGSFDVTVSPPAAADPTASFNAAGDTLTLSFTDQFAAGETRAYQAAVRQKSPRGGWRRSCFVTTSASGAPTTESVSTDLPMAGHAEPGVAYETIYRHVGSSCSGGGSGDELWSRVAEATTPGTASFDIDVVFVGSTTAAQRRAVESAVAVWERVLTMSVQNIDFSSNPASGGPCLSGLPDVDDVVDDLRLFVEVTPMDGPSGTLAGAGLCWTRQTSGLPIIGRILVDAFDFDARDADGMRQILVHEIAHVLGFTDSPWHAASLLRNPSLLRDGGDAFGSPDTHFAGPLAVAAFNAAGGSAYANGKVPVENRGGAGSQDSHWRESVLDDELMTSSIDRGSNPLSAITIQAMADLGYHVDVSQAESYRLPSARSGVGRHGLAATAKRASAKSALLGRSGATTAASQCVVKNAPRAFDDSGKVALQPNAVRMRSVATQ